MRWLCLCLLLGSMLVACTKILGDDFSVVPAPQTTADGGSGRAGSGGTAGAAGTRGSGGGSGSNGTGGSVGQAGDASFDPDAGVEKEAGGVDTGPPPCDAAD